MSNILMKLSKKLMVLLTCMTLMLPAYGFADQNTEKPNAWEMGADLVIARPIGFVGTILGTVVFVVSLPFSLLGGNVGDAADALVIGPAKTTFLRCLGCANNTQSD